MDIHCFKLCYILSTAKFPECNEKQQTLVRQYVMSELYFDNNRRLRLAIEVRCCKDNIFFPNT